MFVFVVVVCTVKPPPVGHLPKWDTFGQSGIFFCHLLIVVKTDKITYEVLVHKALHWALYLVWFQNMVHEQTSILLTIVYCCPWIILCVNNLEIIFFHSIWIKCSQHPAKMAGFTKWDTLLNWTHWGGPRGVPLSEVLYINPYFMVIYNLNPHVQINCICSKEWGEILETVL